MPKLTRSRLSQIEEILDASLFTSAAFDVVSTDNSGEVVSITYRDETRFHARLFNAPKTPKSFQEEMVIFGNVRARVLFSDFCPGNYVETEQTEDTNFDAFLRDLSGWTDRLRNEIILVGAFQKQFHGFREELNKKLDEHFADASAHFTSEEKADALGRLGEFEKRIAELEKSRQISEAQLSELRKIIADLSQASASLPKRAWFRTACSKLYAVSSKIAASESGQKAIAATINRLLEPPKSI